MNRNLLRGIDGTFPPGGIKEEQGVYQECIVPPVRILAWWDRSIDNRPQSNSALIGYDYSSASEMLEDAAKMFPSVIKRQPSLRSTLSKLGVAPPEGKS